MEKDKLIKLNIKLEKDIDKDIIEILDRVQNKTLFTKTAIRLAYQQMLEDTSIARVREPQIFNWDKFVQDVQDTRNNSVSCISVSSNVETQNIGKEDADEELDSDVEDTDEELEDDELY